jgi:hypothetical protein
MVGRISSFAPKLSKIFENVETQYILPDDADRYGIIDSTGKVTIYEKKSLKGN